MKLTSSGPIMRLLSLFLLAVAALSSGCATATRGTAEPVTFVSVPPGATMETSTGLMCITPCTLQIPRSDTFTAIFTLNDEVKSVFVDTEISDDTAGTTAANLLMTPIIAIPGAIIVDAASGANLDHTPNPVRVVFEQAADLDVPKRTGPSAAESAPLQGKLGSGQGSQSPATTN